MVGMCEGRSIFLWRQRVKVVHPLDPGSDEAHGFRTVGADSKPSPPPITHTRAHTRVSVRRGGGARHSPTAHSPAAPQRPRPQAVPRRCPGGLCGGGNPGLPPRAPQQRLWPRGAGRRGRGDIIRAAPPPASTAPQARRSIHDIIGLISTPLPPRPQQRDAPPPQLRVPPEESRGAEGTGIG